MKNTTTISIDLAKEVFQVAVFNKHGKLISNQAVNSKKMVRIIAKHSEANILMEACGSSHYWGRRFAKEGHAIYLVPAHIAAKYRSGNKNDSNDALAIYEAAKRPKTYFVAVRTLEQQDIATQHKLRQGFIKQRTQVANRVRGFAREHGVNFPLGIKHLYHCVPDALEDAENELTIIARRILRILLDQLIQLRDVIEETTELLEAHTKTIPSCKAIQKIPGIGWISAGAYYARVGNGSAYRRGRDVSASIGIVPMHSGSGGKNKLGSISKRGDRYLRYLLVHGARSAIYHVGDKTDGLSCWIRKQLKHNSVNKTAVALANKLSRMAWAILSSGGQYQAPGRTGSLN
jgi:transposase